MTFPKRKRETDVIYQGTTERETELRARLEQYHRPFQLWIKEGPTWDNRRSYIFEKKNDGDYRYPEIAGLFRAYVKGHEDGNAAEPSLI